jgi:predicted HAD superfamily Cof-like phosphohydrolase
METCNRHLGESQLADSKVTFTCARKAGHPGPCTARLGHARDLDEACKTKPHPLDNKALTTPVAKSNLFTMRAASKSSHKSAVLQVVGEPYTVPSPDVLWLRLKLCFDELFELTRACGFTVYAPEPPALGVEMQLEEWKNLTVKHDLDHDLEEIIDGVCDLIYVATGLLVACGVPDLPHLLEVNRCNNAKFPDGVAIISESGRYEKPVGWKPPIHTGLTGVQHRTHLTLEGVNCEEVAPGWAVGIVRQRLFQAMAEADKKSAEYTDAQTRRLGHLELAAVKDYRRHLEAAINALFPKGAGGPGLASAGQDKQGDTGGTEVQHGEGEGRHAGDSP